MYTIQVVDNNELRVLKYLAAYVSTIGHVV